MMHSKNLVLALLALCLPSSIAVAQQDEKENASPQLHFQSGVIVDGDLLAVDKAGHLVRLNATWGGKHDYGTFDKELGPHVATAGNKAYVTTPGEVCEVDLEAGKIIRTATQGVGQGRVGVIDEQRVFVQDGARIEIVNLDSNETIHSLELVESNRRKMFKFSASPHVLDEDALYIALSDGSAIAEIDVNRGVVARRIETNFHWVTGLHVVGQNLYACQLTSSYGIIHESLTAFDLDTLQPSRLEIPDSRAHSRDRLLDDNDTYSPIAMVSHADGGFSLSVAHGVYQFDKQGQLVAKSAALKAGQRLIAATTYEIILSTADGYLANELSDVDSSVK